VARPPFTNGTATLIFSNFLGVLSMVDFAKALEEKRSKRKLHLDFETRSMVDLKVFGLDIYSNHETTDVWCMCYAFDEEPVQVWRIGDALPREIYDHVKAGGSVTGHNVTFEFSIWNNCMRKKHGWPTLKISQCYCTMAMAYAMCLPPSLKMLAKALNTATQKDMDGHSLMMSMSKPRSLENGKPIWWEVPERLERLIKYCINDVAAERDCERLMVPLGERERAVWLLDQRINQRGIGVDRDAVEKTLVLAKRVQKDLNKQIKAVTEGTIEETSEATAILKWCNDNGVPMESLKKHDMEEWLEIEHLPSNVREVLEIRGDAAKISVKKLDVMLNMSLRDGRLRGQFQYHGAGPGRWSGRGVQLHNLPRPSKEYKDAALQQAIIEGIRSGYLDENDIDNLYGPFMRVVSSLVRGYLVSTTGQDFIGADLANIEGRVLAWLAGEQWKLDAFAAFDKGQGEDIYLLTAGRILVKSPKAINDDERQAYGKVPELALGYGGGVGAFQSMAVNYNVKVTNAKADEIKIDWREVHPATTAYWKQLNNAAMSAVRNAGGTFYAGAKGREVAFKVAGSFLWVKLPSGRCLCYPFPEISMVKAPWGDQISCVTYMGIDGRAKSKTKGKWTRLSTYGGYWAENVTQAVARDILVEGMFRMEAKNYPIVLHVHDENVAEVAKEYGDIKEVEHLMSIVPPWAQGLPISAKGFRGTRYRKA
jgi:DNA polymerase